MTLQQQIHEDLSGRLDSKQIWGEGEPSDHSCILCLRYLGENITLIDINFIIHIYLSLVLQYKERILIHKSVSVSA